MGITTTPQKPLNLSLSLFLSLFSVFGIHYCCMVFRRLFSVIFISTANLFCVVLLQPRCSGGHYRGNNPFSCLQVAVADNNYTALQPIQHIIIIINKIPFSSFFLLLFFLLSFLKGEAVGKGRREGERERCWDDINQVGVDIHSAGGLNPFFFPRVGFPILPETLKE